MVLIIICKLKGEKKENLGMSEAFASADRLQF